MSKSILHFFETDFDIRLVFENLLWVSSSASWSDMDMNILDVDPLQEPTQGEPSFGP